MATRYTVNNTTVEGLLGQIKAGSIAVPELQRPFVWKPSQVRDLIDSLYNGFPTGYLITWQNPQVRLRNGEMSGSRMILIDGQQRITAMMAALAGRKVVDENYNQRRIAIAFNPFPEPGGERFEVQDESHRKSKRWIQDISVMFDSTFSTFSFIKRYCEENEGVDGDELNAEITRLKSLANVPIGLIVLNQDLDIETVTEIFIRINSEGTVLNQADFVMSRMSANEDYGGERLRKTIDYFCHLIKEPGFIESIKRIDPAFYESEGKRMRWVTGLKDLVFDPDYSDMVRVAFMYRFNRAKMSDLVSLMSGRNFQTKTYEESIIEDTFSGMSEAVRRFINENNYKTFLTCIESTGFENSKQVTSAMTIDFAYALFLKLLDDKMPREKVMNYVGRWFVMTVLTGRYTGSPESKMDRDLRMIAEKGFENYLYELEESELSDSFWDVKLVQSMETSRYTNPSFYTYLASQNFSGESSLLTMNTKVQSLARNDIGDIHHIFPKAYLMKHGFPTVKYNQLANYAYISKPTNLAISDRAPAEYFGIVRDQCRSKKAEIGDITDESELKRNLEHNCIPPEIFDMDYDDYEAFLLSRRKMIAAHIRSYYEKIKSRC